MESHFWSAIVLVSFRRCFISHMMVCAIVAGMALLMLIDLTNAQIIIYPPPYPIRKSAFTGNELIGDAFIDGDNFTLRVKIRDPAGISRDPIVEFEDNRTGNRLFNYKLDMLSGNISDGMWECNVIVSNTIVHNVSRMDINVLAVNMTGGMISEKIVVEVDSENPIASDVEVEFFRPKILGGDNVTLRVTGVRDNRGIAEIIVNASELGGPEKLDIAPYQGFSGIYEYEITVPKSVPSGGKSINVTLVDINNNTNTFVSPIYPYVSVERNYVTLSPPRGTRISAYVAQKTGILNVTIDGVSPNVIGALINLTYNKTLINITEADIISSIPYIRIGATFYIISNNTALISITLASGSPLPEVDRQSLFYIYYHPTPITKDLTNNAPLKKIECELNLSLVKLTNKEGGEITPKQKSASSTLYIQRYPGDIDGYGIVGISDFSIFAPAYGKVKGEPMYNANADLNEDEIIDVFDFGIFATHYGDDIRYIT